MSGMCNSPSVEPKPGDVHPREFLFSDPASPPSCSNPRGTVHRDSRRQIQRCSLHCGKGLKVAQASIAGGWK